MRRPRVDERVPNNGGGEDMVERLCCRGYQGKGTVRGGCAGEERERVESEKQRSLSTRDKLKVKKKIWILSIGEEREENKGKTKEKVDVPIRENIREKG